MSFLSKLWDGAQSFLFGNNESSGGQLTTSSQKASKRTKEDTAIYDAYMQQLFGDYVKPEKTWWGKTITPGHYEGTNLLDQLAGQEQFLGTEFQDYLNALKGATGEYGNTVDQLTTRLNDPGRQIGFGIEGGDQVSFTPRSERETVTLLEQLAGGARDNSMMAPSAEWGFQQEHTPQTAALKYFDLLSQLANANENRRYGLATTTGYGTGTLQGPTEGAIGQLGGLAQAAGPLAMLAML